MVVAIALISIVTASITSTFVEAAQRRRQTGQEAKDRDAAEAINERLDEIVARLSAMERSIDALQPGHRSARMRGVSDK